MSDRTKNLNDFNAINPRGFIGLMTGNDEENTRFGWARFACVDDGAASTLTLVDHAIETGSNTPIVTGAVPEAGTLAHLSFASLIAPLSSRRKSRDSSSGSISVAPPFTRPQRSQVGRGRPIELWEKPDAIHGISDWAGWEF